MSARPGRLLLVNYHYIRGPGEFSVRDPGEVRFAGIHPMLPAEFAAQVRMLADQFHMASPAEARAFVEGDADALPGPSVALTFDDGLAEHARVAADVLEPAGIRGWFFVPSKPAVERRALAVHKVHWLRATLGPKFPAAFDALLPAIWRRGGDAKGEAAARRIYPYDSGADAVLKYRINFTLPQGVVDRVASELLAAGGIDEAQFCARTYLDSAALRRLNKAGHVVGAHGHSHTAFSRLSGEDLDRDVNANRAFLRDLTGADPYWVSYPYGRDWAVPEDAEGFCRRFGFGAGITLATGWNRPGQSRFRLLRINTNEVNEIAAAA